MRRATARGFLGPWFCSLYFNTSTKSKKQTHLEVHTYPHLAEDALNKHLFEGASSPPRECWIAVLKVGPFNEWAHAEAFLHRWALRTRGKLFRLERAVRLFETYRERYQLKMWIQREEMARAVERFFQEAEACVPPPPPSSEEEEEGEEERFSLENMFLSEITIGEIEAVRAELMDPKRRKKPPKKKLIKL